MEVRALEMRAVYSVLKLRQLRFITIREYVFLVDSDSASSCLPCGGNRENRLLISTLSLERFFMVKSLEDIHTFMRVLVMESLDKESSWFL